MGAFETLSAINVNDHTEKKEGLTYLTWSWAWDEIKRKYPDASYSIWKSEAGLPYVYDALTGFMVYTSVTIEGITHEMWLPVMDSKNKAMKAEAYTYKTKYGDKTVDPATMFDINKTIMRCLVKNLAMFGLGLYIYAGEDLPQGEDEEQKPKETKEIKKPERRKNDPSAEAVEEAKLRTKILGYVNRNKFTEEEISKLCKYYKKNSLNELSAENCNHYIAMVSAQGGNIDE